MWDLYDQEKITERMLMDERWNVKTECFKRVMDYLELSFEETAEALEIPKQDWHKIEIRLSRF